VNGQRPSPAPTSTDTPAHPWGGWPVVRPVPPWRVWVWGIAYWFALAPLTWSPRMSGNVFSRYMTIEAIVERGTLAIERSPLLRRSGSPDIVRFHSHFYSDKPPVLPAIASPIYAALVFAGGIRFSGPVEQFYLSNFALTWGLVGLASSLTLVALRSMLRGVAIPPWAADLATLAFGLASPLLTYAVTFNNHSVAAGCVAGAWAFALMEGPKSKAGRMRFASGFLAALAAAIDLPVGALTVAGLAAIQLIRSRSGIWIYLAGAVGPLLLHSGLQSLVTGTPLPAEMYPSAFEYPGSFWMSPGGVWKETGPRWLFGLDFLVGRQGAFTVFPAIWFGLVGLAGGMMARDRSERWSAWIVAGSLVVLIWYYVWGVRRTDFAGTSFGVRHMLPITPMVYLFGVVALGRARRWRMVAIGLFVAAMAIGGIYAIKGMINPWSRAETRAEADPLLRAVQRLAFFQGGTFRVDFIAPQPNPGGGAR